LAPGRPAVLRYVLFVLFINGIAN